MLEESDPERDEVGLRSLFGDGAVVLPADKHIEGEKLFTILANLGVEIFNRVFAKTQEVFTKGYEDFRGSEMSFIVGFGSMGPNGADDGEFKATIEVKDCFYGGRYEKFLIFYLYRKELGDFSSGEWIEIKKLESSEYQSFWGKFLKFKEALLAEFSK